MRNNIIKLLNLKGFFVDKIESLEKERKILVWVRSPRVRTSCPFCNRGTSKVHQYKLREVKHGWFQGKQIILKVKYRRFKCKFCTKVFTEKLPGIDRKRYTYQFRENVLSELKMASFSSTAKKLNISPNTLIRFLRELKLNGSEKIMWPKRGEIVLGIDAHSFSGKYLVTTITELKRHRLLKVLPDNKQITLIRFLNSIPKQVKSRIRIVCIDMDNRFKSAIRKSLPYTKIVVDKYHVLKEGERVLEYIRLIIQEINDKRYGRIPKQLLLKPKERLTDLERKKLELIWEKYKNYPCLQTAWWAKEKIRDIYYSPNYQIARYKLKSLIFYLETERTGELKVLAGTLRRWKEYILNYFHTYVTNGYTEGLNNKIKLIKRISFGFRNIQNYIAKITLAFLPLFWLMSHHTF